MELLIPALVIVWGALTLNYLRGILLELRWLNRREEAKSGLERQVNFFLGGSR